MQTIQTLQNEIARIKKELEALNRSKVHRKDYVVDYSKLTKVRDGYVHPEILAMYN